MDFLFNQEEKVPIEKISNPVFDKTNFKLPIEYLEESKIHNLSPIVESDLELTNSMYPVLLNSKNELSTAMIQRFKTNYTSDATFLNQTQTIIKTAVVPLSEELDAANVLNVWRDIYEVDGFKERHGYIDMAQINFVNKMSTFMGYWTIMNLVSPLFSIILPFLFILAPFVMLRIQLVPITFSTYITMLKELAKSHAIGKTLTSFENFSINNLIYVLFTLGMYGLQMYQNCKHCIRFYTNITTINANLMTVKKFVDQSIITVETFAEKSRHHSKYSKFCENALTKVAVLRQIQDDLRNVEPFEGGAWSVAKRCFEVGYLLKSYYCLHDIPEYRDAFSYAIAFEGYRSGLEGIATNIQTGFVNCGEFSDEFKTKFTKQVYPTLISANTVSKTFAISNDMSLENNMIITGPNASGKTTQLKTTAINVIFTQQFGVGFYEKCEMAPYTHIHSYLNIPDTSGRDSLFQAEARRCKDILDIIDMSNESNNLLHDKSHDLLKNKSKHFCIFDELFSGTNAEEATSASYGFLKYLQKRENVDFILTTHFVKLCKKVKKNTTGLRIANYKMDATLEDDKIHFTYKMVKGISKIKAARLILIQMGFPDEIINS
jgi:ABC-type branched-subunit amino acid transport system ATPase component